MLRSGTIRVLLALSSPLVRMRLKHALALDANIRIIGEAAEGVAAAEQAQALDPQIIICDERVLSDPAIAALFANKRRKANYCIVLVAANSRMPGQHGQVPVTAVLAIDLSSEELVMRLRHALEIEPEVLPPPPPPPKVVGMEHRFVIADQVDPRASKTQGATGPLVAGSTQMLPTATAGSVAQTMRFGLTSRREHSPGQDQLALLLTNMQAGGEQQRDSLTGLGNTRALGLALRSLPGINCPAAVAVVDIWYGDVVTPALGIATQRAVLRSAAATIRANVRHEDLVCRLEGLTFAIVMPGLDRHNSTTPIRRLHTAMAELRLSSDGLGEPTVVIGVGYWEPGLQPAYPLERAWQIIKAERDQGSSL